MKNLLTLLVSVSLVLFLSRASASAQGRGLGSSAGASVGQGHGADHDHDHDQAKNDSGPKGDHDSHTAWQTRFNDRLQKDPALAAKVQNLLPPGTDLKTAEMGFKNQGQFLAAAHVSKNLGIPWDQLKAAVTGMNAQGQSVSAPMSLGKAIQELKPTLTHDQVNDAVKKAEKQAQENTEKTKDDHDTAWQTNFNERLQKDPALAAKVQNLLPSGTNLKTAEMGFENRGQFLAALIVSKNLGIPFDQLKAKITGLNAQGQTVSTEVSLGKAIHELKPTLTQDQVTDAVKTAEKQAEEDTERTGSNATD